MPMDPDDPDEFVSDGTEVWRPARDVFLEARARLEARIAARKARERGMAKAAPSLCGAMSSLRIIQSAMERGGSATPTTLMDFEVIRIQVYDALWALGIRMSEAELEELGRINAEDLPDQLGQIILAVPAPPPDASGSR
jgi:hypothetical protein